MEREGINLLINSTVLFAIFVGACVLLLMYIIKLLNADQKAEDDKAKNERQLEQTEKKKESAAAGSKGKKKATEGRWTGRSDKQAFSHPWLLTSLKGHTAQVLDMDFASNGKYLASCAEEDPDPGGDLDLGFDGGDTSSTSSGACGGGLNSGSSSNQEEESSSPPSSAAPSPRTKGLSRRQRKNRRRDDPSPPENKKKTRAKRPSCDGGGGGAPAPNSRRPLVTAPLKQYLKLNLAERDSAAFLRSYLLSPEQMLAMGYPMESSYHPGRAIIFKSPLSVPAYTQSNYRCCTKVNVNESRFDVNAQEFVPGMDYSEIRAEWSSSHDSGQGSGSSSDSGENLDDSEESSTSSADRDVVLPQSRGSDKKKAVSNDKRRFDDLILRNRTVPGDHTGQRCVRCGNVFYVTKDGDYLSHERCVYHWGKLQNVLAPSVGSGGKHSRAYGFSSEYGCCRGRPDSRGCTTGKLHVWNGLSEGFNGPFDCYVRTRPRKTLPPDGNFGVYALDCEMCYTAAGLELAKVTVVGTDGRLVYDSFVRPEREVIDYNTRFSGITAKDLNKKSATKTLREVQNDLMGFVNADTILVGHGLENDLRALRIMHYTVVDTAVAFPHYNGLPYRRSLKSLVSSFLKREIQGGANGHNSFEDARACMELMLWRIRKDFGSILEHYH